MFLGNTKVVMLLGDQVRQEQIQETVPVRSCMLQV